MILTNASYGLLYQYKVKPAGWLTQILLCLLSSILPMDCDLTIAMLLIMHAYHTQKVTKSLFRIRPLASNRHYPAASRPQKPLASSIQLLFPGTGSLPVYSPPLPPPAASNLARNSGGTVGMYLRSLSLLTPPKPAPNETSMSVLVGSEKGNISAGSSSKCSGASSSSPFGLCGCGVVGDSVP